MFLKLITDNAFDTSWGRVNHTAGALDVAQDLVRLLPADIYDKEARLLLKAEGINVIEVEDKTAWREACSPIVEEYTKGERDELIIKS